MEPTHTKFSSSFCPSVVPASFILLLVFSPQARQEERAERKEARKERRRQGACAWELVSVLTVVARSFSLRGLVVGRQSGKEQERAKS
jgi:hypothetical protein